MIHSPVSEFNKNLEKMEFINNRSSTRNQRNHKQNGVDLNSVQLEEYKDADDGGQNDLSDN